jgi:hypothetical protein
VNEPERWYGSEMGLNKWLKEMEEGLAAAVRE